MKLPPVARAALALWLVALAALSLYPLARPAVPLPADAPPGVFSAARAAAHLAEIARMPHPLGSREQADVRAYLLEQLAALGLSPRVQGFGPGGAGVNGADAVGYNVLARLAGRERGPAVLLFAHYDSAAAGPGAGDDGLSVAALLEVARALRAYPPLRHDVIFLFTDGEEEGLWGAQAFVARHPWARDVAVAILLEGGNRGPSVPLETSSGNGRLVDAYARAAPEPFAASWAYDVFRLLPYDTDFTVLRRAGIAGYYFSPLDSTAEYHTALDRPASVAPSTLQHHGAQTLALVRRLADLEDPGERAPDEVYFSAWPLGLFYYSHGWATALAVLVALISAAAVALAARRRALAFRAPFLGVAAVPAVALAGAALVALLWRLAVALDPACRTLSPSGHCPGGVLYLAGAAALVTGVFLAAYARLRRIARGEGMALGAALLDLALLGATSVLLPGASYLFAWPLLAELAALAAILLAGERAPWLQWLILGLAAAPAVLLWLPAIYMLFLGLGVSYFPALVIPETLLLGLLAPQLEAVLRPPP